MVVNNDLIAFMLNSNKKDRASVHAEINNMF